MGIYGCQWVFQIKLQIFEMSYGYESGTSCSRLRDGDHKLQTIDAMIAVIGEKSSWNVLIWAMVPDGL
jgi:hypothetical protein